MSKFISHLKTIATHRKYVRKACFKMGLFTQGLLHDLQKYSIEELKICKYYTGTRSPHQVCREAIGYSPSWIHHYHSRFGKHHNQHWLDDTESGELIPIKMPYKYVIESFCDMIGAGKAYSAGKGITWRCTDPWDYWVKNCQGKRIMHAESAYLMEKLLWALHEWGEDKFFEWYKKAKYWLKASYEGGLLKQVDTIAF